MDLKLVKPGIYRHYKGDAYRVLFTALESTNGRPVVPVVVYVGVSKGEHQAIRVRDLVEFSGKVKIGKLLQSRFTWMHE